MLQTIYDLLTFINKKKWTVQAGTYKAYYVPVALTKSAAVALVLKPAVKRALFVADATKSETRQPLL